MGSPVMSKRLHVLFDDEEYLEIQAAAWRQRITVAEWVRRALRKSRNEYSATVEAKLRAIADASRHDYPTANIEVMIREVEAGR